MSPARAHPTAIGTIELDLDASDLFAQKSIFVLKVLLFVNGWTIMLLMVIVKLFDKLRTSFLSHW